MLDIPMDVICEYGQSLDILHLSIFPLEIVHQNLEYDSTNTQHDPRQMTIIPNHAVMAIEELRAPTGLLQNKK